MGPLRQGRETIERQALAKQRVGIIIIGDMILRGGPPPPVVARPARAALGHVGMVVQVAMFLTRVHGEKKNKVIFIK